ncbi:hypothetical protein Csa_010598 [Cucumis sativus]|uniref:Uncharacterized protein n=1 Tax=Cucumis sativus TaxID=3659 RepID=A0A0A0L6W8_CUCSA|nr:hypothetical protein Csa_010598 [Cucumis sativus]
MESTSSPDADFIGLATRTPTRSTLGIQAGEDVAEEFEKQEIINTLLEEKVSTHKKEEILAHSRMLLQAQAEEM